MHYLSTFFPLVAAHDVAQCPRTDLNKKKSLQPDQQLSQHERLYPIGLKSARIEMPSIDFSKTFFY